MFTGFMPGLLSIWKREFFLQVTLMSVFPETGELYFHLKMIYSQNLKLSSGDDLHIPLIPMPIIY